MRGIEAVLSRLSNARKNSSGWYARCPAHDDRLPSLSIREGREGALLRCFAGCSLTEIVAALGLKVSDLFKMPRRCEAIATKPKRQLTTVEIENALHAHLKRILDEETHRLGYAPPTASRHHNAARQTVARLFGVRIPPATPAWWEVGSAHDDDPLWPIFTARALCEIMARRYHPDASLSVAALDDCMDAQEQAASWIHDEACVTIVLTKMRGAA